MRAKYINNLLNEFSKPNNVKLDNSGRIKKSNAPSNVKYNYNRGLKNNKINESLEDLFKPKSKEDIIRDLSKLSQNELNNKLRDASRNGITSVIQYLIDAGANVNYKDINGWTALMLASTYGHKDIVKLLKKHGAKE